MIIIITIITVAVVVVVVVVSMGVKTVYFRQNKTKGGRTLLAFHSNISPLLPSLALSLATSFLNLTVFRLKFLQ